MAYDESGNRIWYSVEDADGSGYALATLPGVGVYYADRTSGSLGKFSLKRMDLVAGGFREGVNGAVYIPVADAQRNVRGYASKGGLESAYGYYAYGTVDEIANGTADDNKRWQGKEFDGEHGKYYFGARYFDPFFALWMSPDPAGQFSNPYTYGGDPVNFVDPNGEEVATAVIVGAIVGAIIGGTTAAYQCSNYGGGSCTEGVSTGAIIGAAAGAAGGASSWAAGGFALDAAASASGGLAANMTLGEAVGLSALSVGAGSGASYTASYALSTPFDDWDLDDFFTGFNTSVISGAVVGAAMGAASWGISYSANLENQARRESLYKRDAEGNILYDENGKTQYRDDISESRKFVDKEYKKQNNGLYKGPTDTKFQASVIKEDQYPELYNQVKKKLPVAGDYRYTDGSNLHVNAKEVDVIRPDGTADKILRYEGHFDFYNPKSSVSQWFLHGYEFLRGKNYFDPYAAASALRSSPDSDGFLFW